MSDFKELFSIPILEHNVSDRIADDVEQFVVPR